jgi:hypothetical protein
MLLALFLAPAAAMAEDFPVAHGYKMAGELRQMYEEEPDAQQVIDVAKGLVGARWSRPGDLVTAFESLGRQALHAYLLALEHPRTGELLHWEAPLPEDLMLLQSALEAAL